MQKKPLLLFDIDGTVTDTKAIDDHCFLKAFEHEFGVAVKFSGWNSYKHVTDSAIFKELYHSSFGEVAGENHKLRFISRFNFLLDAARINQPASFHPIPGSADFIKLASLERNFPIAFATGANKNSAKMKLNAIGIDIESFPHASSDDSDLREEIMITAVSRSSTHYGSTIFNEESGIIYFGDGEWDFHATQNLKMPFIGVDVKQSGKLEKLGTKNIIQDYKNTEKVFEIIREMHSITHSKS
jgi:phosphoglycolate phosphatase-like HAD superfamily hydrolase